MLGPITLSDYDADRRCWKLRDKSVLGVRVATFYRVMHMRERSRKEGCMRKMRRLFSGWGELSRTHRHSTWRCRLRMGLGQQWTSSGPHWSAGVYVSASTRMRMTDNGA